MHVAVVLIHLVEGIGLDNGLRRGWIPAKAHQAGAELFLNRLEIGVVHELEGSARRKAESSTHPPTPPLAPPDPAA